MHGLPLNEIFAFWFCATALFLIVFLASHPELRQIMASSGLTEQLTITECIRNYLLNHSFHEIGARNWQNGLVFTLFCMFNLPGGLL